MNIFKSRTFWFLLGFILGPIVVIESFGHYTQWRIEQMDLTNAERMQAAQRLSTPVVQK